MFLQALAPLLPLVDSPSLHGMHVYTSVVGRGVGEKVSGKQMVTPSVAVLA
jgi:hypothetical protein